MRTFSILLATSLLLNAYGEEAEKFYLEASKTAELKAKEGQVVTVYGKTTGSGKSGSGMNFVNFSDAEFYLVTFRSDLTQFPDGEPADVFDEKRIAVEGVVSIYKDKPQIKLTDPKMVTVLEADQEFPPKKMKTVEKTEPKEPEQKKEAPQKTKPEEPKKKPPVDPKKYFK